MDSIEEPRCESGRRTTSSGFWNRKGFRASQMARCGYRIKEQLNNSNRATAQHILKNMKLFQEINLSSCRENVNLFVFYLYGVIRKLHVELFGGLEDLF
jgi:hypothetical protein